MATQVSRPYDESTVGMVPSFALPGAWTFGPGRASSLPPAMEGSAAGVPAPDSMPLSSGGNAAAQREYGVMAASRGPTGQPVFWAFVLFVLGVAMLGHVAHFNLRPTRA